jgi:hypothetical protein
MLGGQPSQSSYDGRPPAVFVASAHIYAADAAWVREAAD